MSGVAIAPRIEGVDPIFIDEEGRISIGAQGASSQTAWFIDPVAGSDSNSGSTALSPVQSSERVMDLIGAQEVDVPMVFHLLNPFPADNPFHADFSLEDGGTLLFQSDMTPTTLYSGTITGKIDIAAATNQPQEIEDTGIGNPWPAGDINTATGAAVWVRITSAGARLGAVALPWAVGTNPSGVKTSAFVVPDAAALPLSPAAAVVSPQIGDTFVVETLPMTIADFRVCIKGSGILIANSTRVLFRDISFPNNATTRPIIQMWGGSPNNAIPPVLFSRCDVARMEPHGGTMLGLVDCKVSTAQIRHGQVSVSSGLVTQPLAFMGSSARSQLVRDVCFALGGSLSVEVADILVDRAGFFSTTVADAITVHPGCTLRSETVAVADAVYGVGATANGARIYSTGGMTYVNKPTVTGATNNSIIGGTAKAWGAVPFIEPANNAAIVLRA